MTVVETEGESVYYKTKCVRPQDREDEGVRMRKRMCEVVCDVKNYSQDRKMLIFLHPVNFTF